jgi:hypothetical protein
MTTQHPKIRGAAFALFLASSIVARAGTPIPDSKEAKEPAPPLEEPWKFSLAVPSWLAAMSGTIGLDGVNAHIYMGADTMLKHLDMTASLSAEARKGRFGVYGDFLCVKVSDAVYPSGLISKADIHLDEWLADLEVSYRLVEGPKGYLDFRVGVRYTDTYNALITNANDSAIHEASTRLVDDVSGKVAERLSELDLKSRLRTVLEDRIRARLTNHLAGLQSDRPVLPIAPLRGRRPTEIDALVRQAVDHRLDDLTAALRSRDAAKSDALRAAAQARVDALKSKLTKDIASALKSQLGTSATLNERWLDPYVGFAGRYNFCKAWYLTGKADIGGFGIGSEITWQGYGALGCQVTRLIFLEAGYRYLYTDYDHGGFVYDVTQSGAQITAGIVF